MFRALLWKEWRELWLLRWAGLGLGLALPFVLLAAAEAATRGWLPTGRVASYSAGTIFFDVMPAALALGLWPLIALLTTSQAFAGNRMAGTETFLLERPVPRSRIWTARLLAASGSTALVVFGSLLLWYALVRMSPGTGPEAWSSARLVLGGAGSLIVVTALLAGTAAASLVGTPVAAVLLGLLLGGIPFLLSLAFGGFFVFASYRNVPIGLVIPWLVLAGYFLASFLASCRGEPAGRGRIARGLTVLGIALVCVPLLFAAAAPVAIRVNAARLSGGASVVPSPGTGSIAAVNWSSGTAYLIDAESGERLRFFGPPAREIAWNADGTRLAVVSMAGTFGSFRPSNLRVEFYDRAGVSAGSIPLPARVDPVHAVWSGDRLVIRYNEMTRGGLYVVYPDSGAIHDIPLSGRYHESGIVGPTASGELYVARSTVGTPRNAAAPYTVHRLDLDRGAIDPEPLLRDVGTPYQTRRRLSPSGRYWLMDRNQTGRREPGADAGEPLAGVSVRPVLDLATGNEIFIEGLTWGAWLSGDALVWGEADEASGVKRIRRARPQDPTPTTLREWPAGRQLVINASPDRRRVLVLVYGGESGWGSTPLEMLVYDLAGERWTEVQAPPEALSQSEEPHYRGFEWANPETLALSGPGYLALKSLDRPGELRTVIGSR